MKIFAFLISLISALIGLHSSPAIKSDGMTEPEAQKIAEASCIKGGQALDSGIYNEGTKTWWFDANLNMTKPGCKPACVVNEETRKAEVNWRCTGSSPAPKPADEVITCAPEQRGETACTREYMPVCGKVNIQCIRAPCNPISETFANKCVACTNPLVESYTKGECPSK